MRTAVLVLNYIIVSVLALAFIGLTAPSPDTDPAMTILGIIILAPGAIMSLVYAHSNRDK